MTKRDDARDRLMLSVSCALIELLRARPMCTDPKLTEQIADNLDGCSNDLLKASGIGHGRHSKWRDLINTSGVQK